MNTGSKNLSRLGAEMAKRWAEFQSTHSPREVTALLEAAAADQAARAKLIPAPRPVAPPGQEPG